MVPSQHSRGAVAETVAEASVRQEPSTSQSRRLDGPLRKRHFVFVALFLFSLAAFSTPLATVIRLSLRDERYSHVLLVLPITVFLLYSKRTAVFSSTGYDLTRGIALILLGASIHAATELSPGSLGQDVRLSGSVFAMVIMWVGAFVLYYGKQAFRQALLPLLFLFLLVPLPSALVDQAVVALQHASADTTYVLFKLLRIPVLARGVNLSLPGVDIEIAKECSGIRSGESLVITSILAGYYLLQSAWSRIWLVFLSVPIAILKNAIRITTISCLGIYVNPAFFYGKLHRNGGLPFSLVAVAMMVLVLCLFRRWEAHGRHALESEKVQC